MCSKMVSASTALNIPLIVTEQNPKRLGKTVKEIDVSHAALLDEKMSFSMWTKKVSDYFKSHQHLKSVVLFGIESHVCIYQTALDLMQNNYQVFLVSDCIDSQNPKEVPVAFNQLRHWGAVVCSSDSILFQLLGTAEHPQFKTISGLVKSTLNSKL